MLLAREAKNPPSYHPCPPHPSFHMLVKDLLGAAPHPQGLALVGREAVLVRSSALNDLL